MKNVQYLISQTARVGVGVFLHRRRGFVICKTSDLDPTPISGFWGGLIPITKATPLASNSRRKGFEKLVS